MNRSQNRPGEGFTLVEVLVGLVIFATVAVSIFQVMLLGFRTINHATDVTRVTQILQYQMETLRGTSWANIEKAKGVKKLTVDELGVPTSNSQKIPYNWLEFKMEQELTQVSGSNNLYLVVLRATWKSSSGRSYTKSLSTRISYDGINSYYIRTST